MSDASEAAATGAPLPWCVRNTGHEAAAAHAALRLVRETHFALWERELTG